jgi:hypothetical protein
MMTRYSICWTRQFSAQLPNIAQGNFSASIQGFVKQVRLLGPCLNEYRNASRAHKGMAIYPVRSTPYQFWDYGVVCACISNVRFAWSGGEHG